MISLLYDGKLGKYKALKSVNYPIWHKKETLQEPWVVNISKQLPDADVHHAGNWKGVPGLSKYKGYWWSPKWYQVMRSPKLVPNNENAPYLRSYGHFQMTLYDQRVNIKIIFSFYSIYITYLFRSEDLTPGWLLCQEIQGPKIIDVNNQMVVWLEVRWPFSNDNI